MKVTLALLTAAVSVAAAQPHANHRHQHLHHKREANPDATETTVVSGPTVVSYVLNGDIIPEWEVKQGIANGTLRWSGNGLEQAAPPPPAYSAPSTSVAPAPSSTSVYSAPSPPSSSAAPASSPESSPPQAPPAPSSWQPSGPPSGGPPSGSWGGGDDSDFNQDTSEGVDTPFPSGQLSCDTFPSAYGAVPVPWMGLGGWTGVQTPGSDLGGFSNIMTAVSGAGCSEGSYCSYACPAGYQKSQWPSTQGATGQSVGGILCQNGKLQLTNQGMANTLCMQGATQVKVQVQNKLSGNVAVCRTDYPGTEGETVPLNAMPGSTVPLTCPDAQNYYNWQGSHTSAQYYVNPEGVSVQEACQWGSSANPWGNFAPLNLGVGYSNGAAWLSIFQNLPTTSAQLQFDVEITGDGMSGTCKYSNGNYCGGANYDDCSTTTGCTVSLSSGTATFVFS